MIFVIVAWIICGLAVWLASLPEYRNFSFMADVVIGLPIAVAFGPVFLLARLIS